jgi:acetyl-CoA carboxylase biotin carboxyl carrier protein
LSDKNLSYEEILQIVKVFESSSEFSEFHLKYGDIEVDLRKQGAAPAPARQSTAVSIDAAPAAAVPVPAPHKQTEAPKQAAPAAAPAADAFPTGACMVKSAMVGTFYRAPEPGAQPFVSVGQRVTPDTTVCIIEVMKLMTSIRAGYSGVVTHILVDDATPVEFGQTLIVIDPNA